MEAPRDVVIDAANLTTGGAVTVAASFLDELAALLQRPMPERPWTADLRVEVSPEVLANLTPGTAGALPLEVVRRRPRDPRLWLRTPQPVRLVFTLFGPRHGRTQAGQLVLGFADGLSLYPRPQGLPAEPFRARLWRAARSRVSRAQFRRADHVVTETPAVAERLHTAWGIPQNRLSIVPGTFNAVLRVKDLGDDPSQIWVPREAGTCYLGYVARAHPHKNHEFLAALGPQLAARGVRARFVVTLTAAEWEQRSPLFRAQAVNVGPVTALQLHNLYAQCDAGIFPSLLECFSATPFEVMHMGIPLFASDRDFVRSSCHDAPIYFDPANASAAAETIVTALSDPGRLERHVRRGQQIVTTHPGAQQRALSYLEVMDKMMKGTRE